ncbi:ANTAR domain-containing protein [Nocardia jiangsuensis]|uniref:ANTAR domain-containing protein n=1 Tax=Nocardia jiangsuensis TaxID=1691563 RepID=A0ABV8E066_9NOCA
MAPVCVGRFGYRPDERTIRWARQTAARSGAAADAGDGQMNVQLLLAQVHPQDRAALAQALAGAQRFCLRVRLPDGAGAERTLILLADRDEGEPGSEIEGFYVDLTDELAVQRKALLDDALPRMVETGAQVEQAVGMLQLVYGVTAEKGRELLAWRAEVTGLPVGEFAARLCAAVAGEGAAAPAATRSRVDELLLTLHQRVGADRRRATGVGGGAGR